MCACHVDEPDSILICLAGTKRVALLHPRTPGELRVESRGAACLVRSYDAFQDQRFAQGGEAHGMCRVLTLQRGEAVYIPSRWWHQISSSAGAVAVSIPVCRREAATE